MKKQLYIVVSVLLAALMLFGVYWFFMKEDDTVLEPDPFYILTDPVIAEMQKIEDGVSIVFSGVSESKVKGNAELNRAYLFASAYNEINGKIKVDFAPESGYYGIEIKKGDQNRQILFEELYKAHKDGTKYAFDGENLFTNAILGVCGIKTHMYIELRALDGFDTNGDIVVSGRPFMYPNISRSQVLGILVKNQYGSYKTYRGTDNNFYFEGAELVSYDAEMFSGLIVNATYVLATSKIKDPLELSVYGLDSEENATAVITVITLDNAVHKIIVGKKNPAGTGYYAKYQTKDFVYILPSSDLETSILQPVTAFLKASLVYGISSAQDVLNVDNVVLSFLDDDVTLRARVFAPMFVSGNLKPYGSTDVATLLSNKVGFIGTYTSWAESTLLAGFTSSDGKDVYLEAPLALYGSGGNYTVSFGLLKDESNSAFLPTKIYASVSTDGNSFTEIDIGNITFSQGNREVKSYSFTFQSDEPIRSLRLYFTVASGKYVVLDELSVYADGQDAQPADGVKGGWMLVSPDEYIPEGRLFIYPNYVFSSDFVTKIASLVGDSVVDFGITSTIGDPATLIQSKLQKYGLDTPARYVSYEFKGVTTTVYFSDINENGNYYCYSIISGGSGSSKVDICTDIIAEISVETAPWLGWDIVDFLDHSLLSMYIDTIDKLTLTFDGTDYSFVLHKDQNGKLERVTANGKEVNLKNFRYLYVSIIRINLKGEFNPADGQPTVMLKIKIDSSSTSPEIVFYRVTTSKAYFTIDGEGKYYVLVDSVNTIKKNVGLLLEGKEVPSK